MEYTSNVPWSLWHHASTLSPSCLLLVSFSWCFPWNTNFPQWDCILYTMPLCFSSYNKKKFVLLLERTQSFVYILRELLALTSKSGSCPHLFPIWDFQKQRLCFNVSFHFSFLSARPRMQWAITVVEKIELDSHKNHKSNHAILLYRYLQWLLHSLTMRARAPSAHHKTYQPLSSLCHLHISFLFHLFLAIQTWCVCCLNMPRILPLI